MLSFSIILPIPIICALAWILDVYNMQYTTSHKSTLCPHCSISWLVMTWLRELACKTLTLKKQKNLYWGYFKNSRLNIEVENHLYLHVQYKSLYQRFWARNKTKSDSWAQNLWKRVKSDHSSFCVKGKEARWSKMFFLKLKIIIWVIFKKYEIILRAQFKDLFPPDIWDDETI